MARLISLLCGLAALLFGVIAPCNAAALPEPPGHAYVYDTPADSKALSHTPPKRGPPVELTLYAFLTVDGWSDGASPRPSMPSTAGDTTHARSASLAHVDSGTGTTQGSARAVDTNLTSVQPTGVAAKGGPAQGVPKTSKNFKTPTNTPQLPPSQIPPGWRVREMPPSPDYPNGYWRLEKPVGNGGWQGIDPSTM